MKRVKYASRFARALGREEIDDLVARAAAKNAGLDITGILMGAGRLFFQVIEGPASNVDRLYRQILADDRHEDVVLLGVEHGVAERHFPDWSMRRVDLDDAAERRLEAARELLTELVALHRDADRVQRRLEREILAELARGVHRGARHGAPED